MQRCFDLAFAGLGHVAPNPLVGAVLVHEDKIIGEGFHQAYGEAHAEVNAIDAAIRNGFEKQLEHSTLYVNLEPCSHIGKTPACADLIIRKKIPRVIISCLDPNPLVNGNGVQKLSAAGINVITNVLEEEGRDLNRRFITYIEKKRPYLILKYAQSRDGFIAANEPTSQNRWISNSWSRKIVHQWRSQEAAVLAGTKTIIVDNPSLTVRDWTGKNPIRIVLDRTLKIPGSYHVFDSSAPSLIINEMKNEKKGCLEFVQLDFSKNFIPELLNFLHGREIQSIIVEGGRKVLDTFIENNFWDEARIFTGNKWLGSGIRAPEITGKIISEDMIQDDLLTILKPV